MDEMIRMLRWPDEVIDVALPHSPESLFLEDQSRMKHEAWLRRLTPEQRDLYHKVEAEIEREVLGLPKEEEAA